MNIETRTHRYRLRTVVTLVCVALSLHVLSGCVAQPVDEPESEDKFVQAIPAAGVAAITGLLLVSGVLIWSAQQNRFEAASGYRELDWFAEMLTDVVAWARADGDDRSAEEIVRGLNDADYPDVESYRPVVSEAVDESDASNILSNSRSAAAEAFGRGSVGSGDGCYLATSMGMLRGTIGMHYFAQSDSLARAKSVAYSMCRASSGFVDPMMGCENSGAPQDTNPCPDEAWVMINLGDNNYIFP